MDVQEGQETTGQGYTGTGQATEAAETATIQQPVASPFDSLPAEIRQHEALKDVSDVETLAKRYLETVGKLPQPPKDVKEYQLEIPENYAVDQEYVDSMRAKALELGFTADQFKKLAAAQVEFEQKRATAMEAYSKDLWSKEKQAIALERGTAAFDEDMEFAKKAVKHFFGVETAENFMNESADPLYFRGFAKIGRQMSADGMHFSEAEGATKRVQRDQFGRAILDFNSGG